MDRIQEEAQLKKEYGYKNKKELWKVNSILRNFRGQARRLIPLTSDQANLEKKQLMTRLISLGLVKEDARIEDVLGLTITNLMERRLQSIVLRKKLANTIKQARQFITHGHISIGDKKVTSPSMIVKIGDEPLVSFSGNSELINESHPERVAGKEKRERKNKKEAIEEKMKEVKRKETEKKAEEETGLKENEIKELAGAE